MDKQQREARRHQEDIALQRWLLWVAGAAVFEGLLVLVNRFYIHYYVDEVDIAYGFHYALQGLRIAGPVLAALALIWAAVRLKQGGKTGLPVVLALGCGAVGLCAHVAFTFQDVGVPMLFWLVVAWAVLALVYYLYQREFFLAATSVGLSILGLWFVRYGAGRWLEPALMAAGIAVVLVAALWLKQRDGILPGAGRISFLPQEANYPVVLVSGLAGLAALVAAMVLGSAVAYYLIFLMMAWMFALFVYYTVKLM